MSVLAAIYIAICTVGGGIIGGICAKKDLGWKTVLISAMLWWLFMTILYYSVK